MTGLQDLQSDGTLRRLPIDKQHLKIENLSPAILIRSPAGEDLFTIPFNHIMSFDYHVIGSGSKGQASMEVFDPTHDLMSLTFFNLAQASTFGLPIEVRWGWINVADGFLTASSLESISTKYLSQPYKFIVISVTENPEAHGTTINIEMFPLIMNPVLTTSFVNTTFISGEKERPKDNTLDLIKNSIDPEEYSRYSNAINAYRDLKSNVQENAVVTSTATDPNREAVSATIIQGKLTFQKIYNELMKIADQRQSIAGPRRLERWQRPMLVLPNSADDEYDYQVFEGRNDSVWLCLKRLFNIMVSKSGQTGLKNETFSRLTKTQGSAEKRNRMVGGTFTMHSAKLKNSPTQMRLKSLRDDSTLTPEELDADQENFIFATFNDAEYSYVLDTDEPPIATYVYFGGSKGFDKNNTTEIIDFSITNMDIIKTFYLNNDAMNVTAVTNPTTNVSEKLTNPQTPNTIRGNSPSITPKDNNTSTSIDKDTAIADSSGIRESESETNPSKERNPGNTKATQQVSTVGGRSVQEFDIPFVISQDGESVDNAVRRFLDTLRSRTGKTLPVEAEMTIVGDPNYDATVITALKKIRIIYRNRFGKENHLFSGIYLIKDIKHSIKGGEYRTDLSIQKMPVTQEEGSITEDTDRTGNNRYSNSEQITVALIEVKLSERSSSGNEMQTAFVTKVNAYDGGNSDSDTLRRIENILKNAYPQSLDQNSRRVVIEESLINDINRFISGMTIEEAKAQLTDYVRSKTYKEPKNNKIKGNVTTNFKVKNIII